MDGNGRWAKKKLLPRLVGHNKGLESVRKIIEYCIKYNVKTLTIYAFSTENWKRPIKEVDGLLKLFSCLLYTSPSPRDRQKSRMPSSA